MVGEVTNTALMVVVSILLPMTSPLAVEGGDSLGNQWDVHIVDADMDGQTNYLALSRNGNPTISYKNRPEGQLRFAKWDGMRWNIEIVDEGFHVNGYMSHDLDSKDFPHIAYYDSRWGLTYAKWNGMNWFFEHLDREVEHGTASIAIDASDHPHISYYDNSDESLRYKFWDGSKWNVEIVDGPIPGGKYTFSMALDSNGLPHIGYCATEEYGGHGRIHYAKWDGTSWSIEVPDTNTRACTQLPTSIALDSRDFPHISYFDVTNEDRKYAGWDGRSWILDTVDTRLVGEGSSIAIDSDDNPHIAYVTPSSLWYAERDGDTWKTESVGTNCDYPSLELDQNDLPHMSCSYGTAIGYITKREPPPVRSLSLNIDPDTLNLKSEGRWITAYLTTENAAATDINPLSLLLNDAIPPAWWDVQNDTTLMVKFNRSAVQVIVPVSDEVDIKVTGRWKDGEAFELHDIIRVIDPGGHRVPQSRFFGEKPSSYFREERLIPVPIGKSMERYEVRGSARS
ncbi:MAG: hypothetical protein KAR39_04360 [Thermoplasmata archaeon]|nr:hypothetical protein [Thermoplasmata archaeon]